MAFRWQLLARGDRVVATQRHPEPLNGLAAVHGDQLWVRQIAFPAFALYHATKWGIEGFYEAATAIHQRLAALKQQKAVAFSTDFDATEIAA